MASVSKNGNNHLLLLYHVYTDGLWLLLQCSIISSLDALVFLVTLFVRPPAVRRSMRSMWWPMEQKHFGFFRTAGRSGQLQPTEQLSIRRHHFLSTWFKWHCNFLFLSFSLTAPVANEQQDKTVTNFLPWTKQKTRSVDFIIFNNRRYRVLIDEIWHGEVRCFSLEFGIVSFLVLFQLPMGTVEVVVVVDVAFRLVVVLFVCPWSLAFTFR